MTINNNCEKLCINYVNYIFTKKLLKSWLIYQQVFHKKKINKNKKLKYFSTK